MKDVITVKPNLGGWLEIKLDDKEMKFLWDCIDNKQKSHKKNLAGNVSQSNLLIDKDDWFFNSVLYHLTEKYADEFQNMGDKYPLNRKLLYHMSGFWVNYQKQYEYNRFHSHGGVYSFVIWMKIPTYYFEQRRDNKFAYGSNSRTISNFKFEMIDFLGQMHGQTYEMSPKMEGTMLFFPSKLNHLVYPFYNCEEDRISISGNIGLDVTQQVNE